MLNSIKRLINAHASPRIRQFALFFSEDKKVIKILRFLKFDGAARSYLEKSDRTLFIQKNNLLYWNKSNPEASEILSIVRLEKRSIAYEVQQVILANLLMEATKNSVMKVVEIGSYKGGTAVLFRRLLDHFRSGGGEFLPTIPSRDILTLMRV